MKGINVEGAEYVDLQSFIRLRDSHSILMEDKVRLQARVADLEAKMREHEAWKAQSIELYPALDVVPQPKVEQGGEQNGS